MYRTVIETYGLGAEVLQQLFGVRIEPPREIIDVEYEDLSDEIPSAKSICTEPQKCLEWHNTSTQDADSNNK